MNIKKRKITLLLGASLFLSVPLVSTFADQQHYEMHEMHEMNMSKSMQNVKDELRGYVEGVKSDDAKKMQQHVDALLKLSTMPAMNHADMDHTEMTKDMMASMDHSSMDNSNMDHSDMPMEHTDMKHDMSTMEGMSVEQHQHMMYMQQMTTFHGLFNSLDKTKDKAEISTILAKIKEQIKNSNY